ncbi:MAG: HepT-like ribonuclease domain-containing protein [Jiangellaceae bacterium]
MAEHVLYLDATLDEIAHLVTRGRAAYDSDIAVARACQYNIVRMTADLERLGEAWIEAHPAVPWRLVRGMRNRIAHDYRTIDDDVVWDVVERHAATLHRTIAPDVVQATAMLDEAAPRSPAQPP